MRSQCQWIAFVLVLAGCGVDPRGRAERAAGGAPPPAVEPGASASATELRADEARAFLAAHPEALVLDVRNPDEWNDDLGHIEGARLIPLPELPNRMDEIEAWKQKPVVVVCRVGVRSRTAAEHLRSSGYRQALNLEGGMVAWRVSAPAGGK